MKRILSLLLCCMLLITTLTPTAFADPALEEAYKKYRNGGSANESDSESTEGLSLPDLADCAPDAITFAQEQSGVRLYLCDDVDALMDALVKYFTALDSHFGLTGFDTDDESSDVFTYMYVSDYTGSADISPAYMDDCPVPCYLLVAIAGQSDGSLLVAVMAVDGIDFTADMPEIETTSADTTTYAAPVLGEGGLLVMAPEEYNSDIPDVHFLGAQDNHYHYEYVNCGLEYDGRGDNDTWALFKDYVYALVDTGYFEIIEHYEDQDIKNFREYWALAYTGPETVKENFGIVTDGTHDAHIIVNSLLGKVYVYFSQDIVVNNLEEVMEEKGFYVPDPDDPSDPTKPERNCAKCSGFRTVKCTNCWGTGQQSSSNSSGRESCDDCNGRGSVTCDRCNGSGKES